MKSLLELKFAKMHGLGNCFVLVDDRQGEASGAVDEDELARTVCDRDFGIGADGLILVRDSETADLTMRILNEDGSEAEMCGNGIRCFARFAVDEGITDRTELEVDTLAGSMRTRLLDDGRVEVDMGRPSLFSEDVALEPEEGRVRVKLGGRDYTFVSMGNPHAVTFVDEFDFDWRLVGAAVETDEVFPNKINVHFVRVSGPREAEIRVWERGCGVTMACGTGACAAAVAGALEGRLDRAQIAVRLPGGDLDIEWTEDDRVMMTGPAVLVCRGKLFYEPS
jgi:diaminopimelate epimerase